MTKRRQTSAAIALTLASLLAAPATASAQGFFDFLFGGPPRANYRHETPPRSDRPRSMSSYADPREHPAAGAPAHRSYSGGTVSYCVRTCDGRYFPIQPHAGASTVETCHSFCPASPTKIFSGGSEINHAVARDGTRYADLANAFVYRDKIVPGCTCNGKRDGLAAVNVKEDPTLRPGDVVATNQGLVAYSGTAKNQSASFTPVESYSALSRDERRRLSALRVRPAPEPAEQQTMLVPNGATAARDADHRAQASR